MRLKVLNRSALRQLYVSEFQTEGALMLKAFADIVRAIRGTTSNSLSDIRPAGQVRYFTDRFNCLLPKDCTLDKLEEEFLA